MYIGSGYKANWARRLSKFLKTITEPRYLCKTIFRTDCTLDKPVKVFPDFWNKKREKESIRSHNTYAVSVLDFCFALRVCFVCNCAGSGGCTSKGRGADCFAGHTSHDLASPGW